jgi:hypothetical protein
MRPFVPLLLASSLAACEPIERDQSLDPQAGIRRLELVGASGSVHVTADPEADDVTVTAVLVGADARFVKAREGDVLRVVSQCPRHLFDMTCTVDYTVVLPPSVELSVDVIEGEVDVAYAQTPAAIEIRDREGDVVLTVPAGSYALAIEGDGEHAIEGVSVDAHAVPIQIAAARGVSVRGE